MGAVAVAVEATKKGLDGKYGIRDNYKLIISVFAAWRL